MILKKKLIKILSRKRKGESKEDRDRVVDKLRKKERLTGDEFWKVYELIRQEGPQVSFANPDNWIKYHN
ncbi:MAG: hypothetical protein NWE80_01850 [Candidatus Bathyarchaeota archaeon]|nr:hypothetical protein [Candidatus Bathyarchaeota archaeon]